MAILPMIMGNGGSEYTETSLWTNPSPTSSSGFTAQTVTLSEGLSNFKYIGIKYAYDYARTTDSNCVTTDIMLVTDFIKGKNDTSYRKNYMMLGAGLSGISERVIYYTNDTQIYVGVGVGISSGSASTNNTVIIPLEILGINELDHGTVQTATGTFTRGSSTATVECGFEPSFVMIYKTTASSSSIAVGDAWMCLDKGNMPSYVLSAYKSSTSTGGQVFTKYTASDYITTTSTGFTVSSTTSTYQGTYRYIAIGSTTE